MPGSHSQVPGSLRLRLPLWSRSHSAGRSSIHMAAGYSKRLSDRNAVAWA